MERKILAIFAHPDDESFGPSGTLAHYARNGVRVRLLTATRGEAGKNALSNTDEPLGKIRERELLKAAKILGLEKVDFMGYKDKTLQNLEPHPPIEKILHYIEMFKPQILITYGPTGISRHPDHITVHKWVTQVFRMSEYPKKLYYYTLPKELLLARHPDLVDGDGEITTVIDVSSYKNVKKSAILCHISQRYSIERIFDFAGGERPIPEKEYFVLADHKLDYRIDGIEDDLFCGIESGNKTPIGKLL
ncbi:hypothetical protein BBF96_05145 [Anoxybacter fermentans]|uniref:GlcNAc-PI de-N-acetylase n=1 Tax=Anoxybacter fermentans TaxID=1323375 RepID=A0A3S9SX38_9FIRM|nr:PIG-L deacetylase family protein [Anoxybacter fermentans]AZR72828.1 hypothetical protein BBF96_05145 [Anoxybacter fermentans]